MIFKIVLGIVLIAIIRSQNNRINFLEQNLIRSKSSIKKEDKEKKLIIHPTVEKIHYIVQFSIGNFLCFLFPNTFRNKESAEEYYIDFCKKAEVLNEDKNLYNKKKLYYEGSINIDLISGYCSYWNQDTKEQTYTQKIEIFTPNNIKNEELKKEIIQLYNDNFEHLNKILHKHSYMFTDNINFLCPFGDIYLYPYGFKFYDYYNTIPFKKLIKLLRINKTYDLNKYERKQLMKNYKKYLKIWRIKKDYTYILNFKEDSFQIDNKFMRINAYISYNYRPCFEKQFYSDFETYDVDMFINY